MYTTYRTGHRRFSPANHIGTRKYGHKPGSTKQEEKKASTRRKPDKKKTAYCNN